MVSSLSGLPHPAVGIITLLLQMKKRAFPESSHTGFLFLEQPPLLCAPFAHYHNPSHPFSPVLVAYSSGQPFLGTLRNLGLLDMLMTPSAIIYQSYNYLSDASLAHWIPICTGEGECGHLSSCGASLVPGMRKGLIKCLLNKE